MVLAAAAAMCVTGTAGLAGAEPDAPEACAYTLSPPQVVQVSGTAMVTATLDPAGCNRANPYLLVACIQLQGSDGPGQCAQGEGIVPAQVFYQPYRPGAVYISTGRGCANTGNPPTPSCQGAGPFTATL